jgi:MFS family permease
MVATLGVTATVSYGILSYAFAVFITPMERDLGWSRATITGAFSAAQLVAGVTAVPLGRWVDRRGARGAMAAGSVLASLLLVAWSRVETVTAFYAIWIAMGVALAAVLYEPAFAVVATWFRRDRSRALTMLTFIGGFASIVFVPLATLLVEQCGWRGALSWLAAVLLLFTAVPHALVLRRHPRDLGLDPDGSAPARDAGRPGSGRPGSRRPGSRRPGSGRPGSDSGERTVAEWSVPARDAIRGPAFRWLTVAFSLSALTTTAISVHLVPLLLERGSGVGTAAAAMGVLGLMALPGRLVFTPLGGRWPRGTVTASIFALAALAIVVLLAGHGPAAIWTFVVLFGAGFGAITPARAALVAETFGAGSYAEISGVLALVVAMARAAAPLGASLVYETSPGGAGGGYDTVLVVLLVLTLGSLMAVLAFEAEARRVIRR